MKYVAVEKEFELTRKDGTKRSFKVTFDVPQTESLDEMVQFLGGAEEAHSRLNGVIKRAAFASSSLRLNKLDGDISDADLATAISREITATRDYKPESTSGVSKSEKVKQYDNLTSFAAAHPDVMKQLGAVQVLAVMSGERTIEQVLAEAGIALPAAA